MEKKAVLPCEYGFFYEFMKINITVNGEQRDIPVRTSLLVLLKLLNINPDQVAIDYNEDIVDRKQFDSIFLKENDRLEIITFVGGGHG